MGVLDDAIREHLDLKRRHGAAEEELRRQEEEALGPARREVAPAEVDEDGAAAVDGAAEAPAAEAAESTADHPADELAEPELSESLPASAIRSDAHEDQVALDEPTEDYAIVEEEPAGPDTSPRADTPARDLEELEDDDLLDEEEPLDDDELLPREDRAREDARHEELRHDDLADEDARHDALRDEDLADEDEPVEGDDRDLLEDTPDFLEETPEHDRLWFEQKPPRDFDFD